MGWGAVNPNDLPSISSMLELEHELGICLMDCTICEDEAYDLNAQYDCEHKSYTQVQAWGGAKPSRKWCSDCGKDLLT